MLGIFNNMIRRSTGTDKWDAPDHWTQRQHISSHDRQLREAAKHRARLLQGKGLM